MSRSTLLTSAAVIALNAGMALAGPGPALFGKPANYYPDRPTTGILYSQNSPSSYYVDSQNFTSGSFTSYNDAAADDFVVPVGQIWQVTGLDVSGVYFNGSGPATSEVVTFYRNHCTKGHCQPGKGIYNANVVCKAAPLNRFSGESCTLPKRAGKGPGLKLKAGTYWLSFVANCSLQGGCGEWGWYLTTTNHNSPGQYENPGNGFGTGCTSWTNTSACFSSAPSDDYAFDLTGTKR